MLFYVDCQNRPRQRTSSPDEVIQILRAYMTPSDSITIPYLKNMDVGQVTTMQWGFVSADVTRVE